MKFLLTILSLIATSALSVGSANVYFNDSDMPVSGDIVWPTSSTTCGTSGSNTSYADVPSWAAADVCKPIFSGIVRPAALDVIQPHALIQGPSGRYLVTAQFTMQVGTPFTQQGYCRLYVDDQTQIASGITHHSSDTVVTGKLAGVFYTSGVAIVKLQCRINSGTWELRTYAESSSGTPIRMQFTYLGA